MWPQNKNNKNTKKQKKSMKKGQHAFYHFFLATVYLEILDQQNKKNGENQWKIIRNFSLILDTISTRKIQLQSFFSNNN